MIEDLREETPDVQRVGGRQPDVRSQLVVGKSLLDKPLTVVEGPADGGGSDVVAE